MHNLQAEHKSVVEFGAQVELVRPCCSCGWKCGVFYRAGSERSIATFLRHVKRAE